MKISYRPMQTVIAASGHTYTVSVMDIIYPNKERSHVKYALVKTESGQYFIAEWSEYSWTGNNKIGWSINSAPTVSCIGMGHASGADAVKAFIQLKAKV